LASAAAERYWGFRRTGDGRSRSPDIGNGGGSGKGITWYPIAQAGYQHFFAALPIIAALKTRDVHAIKGADRGGRPSAQGTVRARGIGVGLGSA